MKKLKIGPFGRIWRALFGGHAETDHKEEIRFNENSISLSRIPKAPHAFAYLFESFPSFTQTFCFREVEEMLNQGLQFPIFSMWMSADDSVQDFPSRLTGLTSYFPKNIRRWARKTQREEKNRIQAIRAQLASEWGKEKKRAEQTAWLIPILEQLEVRHVHVHFAGVATRTAYWMKKAAGIRYSFTAHANDFWVNSTSQEKHLADLLREAEFVVTETDFSVNWLSERFPSDAHKIHRVYNGISFNRFVRTNLFNPPRILSVGRYIEKKGFFDLIKACTTLKDEKFECLIVGQGALEKTLKQEVQNAGLEGKVFIVGPRTESEIADLLGSTSIFVLPCKTASDGGMDNLPTVIMEAMSASVPVVSTCLAGIPEMVVHGETGYLVNEGDCDALASAIRTLLHDPAAAEAMGARGRVLAQEKFDISKAVGSLKSLLTHYGALRNI